MSENLLAQTLAQTLAQPLELPCGATLSNRLAKAAMTEGLATPQGVPTAALEQLYGLWSDGGAGLLLSGNIIVDKDHLERPGNVVIDREPDANMHQALCRWAAAATRNGNHFWAQISHAGRQTQKPVNAHPKAPSVVKVGLPGGQFGEPVALLTEEIEDIVRRFGVCAAAVKAAGFTGVQVHAAHGYLLSQFLSPRTNLRSDQYGGALANRARPLLDVVKCVRDAVGPHFPVAVKLNSADFQKGGFAFEDSLQVVQWLEKAGVDLVEISGGTYEQPRLLGVGAMEDEEPQDMPQAENSSIAPSTGPTTGTTTASAKASPTAQQTALQTAQSTEQPPSQPIQKSTREREAYFVDFAQAMQEKVTIPLMVTGGFRRRDVMEQAIASGSAELIGLGRPMCIMTDAPQQLLNGVNELPRYEDRLQLYPKWLRFLNRIQTLRTVGTFGIQYWYYAQLDRLGNTGCAEPDMTVMTATLQVMRHQKKWLAARED